MEKWLVDALKAYPCKDMGNGVFRTCPVRLSFPHVFTAQQPKPDKNGNVRGKPKFSAAFLFPHGADLTVLRQEAKRVRENKWPNFKGKLYEPFRDQSEKGHIGGYEEGAYFITARTEKRPQIRKSVGGKLVPIHDEADLYAGCWIIGTVHFYDFSNDEQKGVTVGLNNILKIRDDEAFGGGGSDPDADFAGAAIDLNDGAAINADDLM